MRGDRDLFGKWSATVGPQRRGEQRAWAILALYQQHERSPFAAVTLLPVTNAQDATALPGDEKRLAKLHRNDAPINDRRRFVAALAEKRVELCVTQKARIDHLWRGPLRRWRWQAQIAPRAKLVEGGAADHEK